MSYSVDIPGTHALPNHSEDFEDADGQTPFDFNRPKLIGLHQDSWNQFCTEGLPRLLVELGTLASQCKRWCLRFTGNIRWVENASWIDARSNEQSWRIRCQAEYELGDVLSWISLGDLPAVGPDQTFWVGGIERVVIHQLLRSPGLYWQSKSEPGGKHLRKLQILTERGAHLSITAIGERTKVKLGAEMAFDASSWSEALDCDDDRVMRQINTMYLGSFGRARLNQRLQRFCDVETGLAVEPWVQAEDLVLVWKAWRAWYQEDPPSDDLDGLANKILFCVGRQIEREVHGHLAAFRRRWDSIVSQTRPAIHLDLARVIENFLASSTTSQPLDQTNPLAALAHRRRVTLLGEGGLKRDSVPAALRNVHSSHFGRLCPIDASEGPNVGLRYHLAQYAQADRFGRLSAGVMDKHQGHSSQVFADQTDQEIDLEPGVVLGVDGIRLGEAKRWMWPKAMAPFSSSLIATPFLEHTDAARAVMSAGHQCQALPPWRAEQPLVKTGQEEHLAHEAGMNLYAPSSGMVTYVSSEEIRLTAASRSEDFALKLIKFRPGNTRSSAKVQMHQKPTVEIGQRVEAGQLLADGYASSNGVLSLGANLIVAYMSWHGYNYEDGIVVSERVIRENRLRSVMMKTYEIDVRSTELGNEWLGISLLKPEELLGAHLNPITSKLKSGGEEWIQAHLRPEPFDASAVFFDRTNKHLDPRTGLPSIGSRIESGMLIASRWTPKKSRHELTGEEALFEALGMPEARFKARHVVAGFGEEGVVVKVEVITNPSDLPQSVIARANVTLAHLTHIEVGDKLSGRNGNKGIVTVVVPEEDMPFLPDGTPVDVVLNPLGVPSRMNVGQLYETQLGLCARVLGRSYTVAQFDELYGRPSEALLKAELAKARKIAPWIQEDGRVWLRDGSTGETFDRPVCVGSQYILAQEHLVAKKEHARSQGTYDPVTGQPVAGRKAGGGQRIGEMEAWALMAHGAAHTLQEMMSVKSDDPDTRMHCHKNLCQGKLPDLSKVGLPMALEALVSELRGMGLDMQFKSSY